MEHEKTHYPGSPAQGHGTPSGGLDSSFDLGAAAQIARLALGAVWLYQGIVPKLVFSDALEVDVVERVGLYLVSPQATIAAIGVLEALFGLWLLSGYRARAACLVTTVFLVSLCILILVEEPSLLIGPFGGMIKNLGLLACAWIVWRATPRA